ncbi:MAG: site-2 protease family protein [Candidatus Poseidoniaceae archaeon]
MAGRDPRADILEDDPFTQRPRVHRVHARTGNDGTIHIEMNGKNPREINPLLAQFMGLQPNKPAAMHTGGIWHFSDEEKKHLRLATGAFTLALGFMWIGGLGTLLSSDPTSWLIRLLLAMPVMLLAVGPAFLLHEIGHKIIAKKNGCWAEFRADPSGLRFGVFLAFFLGFLFMAPGAVMVAGVVTRRQNGHIAVAGPLVNFGLFLIGIPVWGLLLGLTGAFDATLLIERGEYLVDGALIWQQMLIDAAEFWIMANLVLGLFNMIPWGPLDGAKVKDWNENVFYGVISIFILLVVTWYTQVWSPSVLLSTIANLV